MCITRTFIFSLFSLTLLAAFVIPEARAQVRRPRPSRYKPRTPYRGSAASTTGATGTSEAVGSAKDDPNFNECKNIPAGRRLKVTLKPDAKLVDLVGWVSSLTCKRFILTKGLRAQEVTIYSPTKVTPYEAYKAFLATLEAMGLTVVQSGKYYKVQEIEKAKGAVNPFYRPGSGVPNTESLVTAMLRVKHADIAEVAEALGKFKSKHGDITIYKPTNLLIITDMGNSITRIRKILRYLDVEGVNNERIWIVKVKHGDATELADKLKEVFGADGGSSTKKTNTRAPSRFDNRRGRGRRTANPKMYNKPATTASVGNSSISKIMADERTNSLIIKADGNSYLEIMALLKKLDVPLPGGEEKIHIVYLENADAEEMAGLLSSLTGSGSGAARSKSNRRSTGRGSTNTRSSSSRMGSYGGYRGSYGANRQGQNNMQGIFKGPVQVQADFGTNALVIVASSKDFLSLRKIIKELDKPRRQVFIEVTILEVSMDKTRNLGLSLHGGSTVGSGDNQSIAFGGTVTNSSNNSILMNPLSLMGFAVGLRGPEIADAETLMGIPGLTFPSFGVFFQALQTNNAVNVVSSPHILTTNNEEAEIMVGENVPFQSGTSSLAGLASSYLGSAGSSYMPTMTSIQRQDVALKLKLTPHVNKSDYVRIEVEQEINEVKSIDPNVGPTTSKRKASTVVVVKDQQTVVIGGLMTEKLKTNVTKVPLLGDLPLLGYLFKSTTKMVEKTNLLIFITPYIIRDSSDLRKIFREKMKQRKEFIEKFGAFKDHDIDRPIDYRYKVGLFEEINREIIKASNEVEMKKKAMEEYKDVDNSGPVIVGSNELVNLQKKLKESRDRPDPKSKKKPESKGGASKTAPVKGIKGTK
ncbi:type II secretion system secretin GspD [Myxococcota bacterium]|nr:type II secretion system secretin GspD [Myxococcota bacterium]